MGETLCCSLIYFTSHPWPAPGWMHPPGCACLLWSHVAGWARQRTGHGALCGIAIPTGQRTAPGLLEGEGPFLLYQAQYKSTHPLVPVALRKPWSCSHLGNVGGGGSGERFRSGTEYAGEHLLPGAAGDLRDTERWSQRDIVGEPPAPAPREPGPSHWDAPTQPRERRAWQGKKALSCASNCTEGLGGTGRGFHRDPRPTAAGKGLCSGQRVSWQLLALPHPPSGPV